jgi:CheY-like chemotaxis protein
LPTPDLIVHDDETVLAVASDLIQRFACNALVASNSVDALEILRRNQDVAVLFSDIRMPGMNGAELPRAAAGLRPGRRVILTPGGVRRPTIAAAFVPKPYRAPTWREMLQVLKYPGVNPKRANEPDDAPVSNRIPPLRSLSTRHRLRNAKAGQEG